MNKLILILTFIAGINISVVNGQQELLNAGPMVGQSQMREVTLWAQTTEPADVKIVYWNVNDNSVTYYTNVVATEKSKAYTAHLVADEVEPGQKYNYELYINDQKVNRPYPLEFTTLKLWQWREDPPNVKFVTGSCAYINEDEYDRPGSSYGGYYEIFESIYKTDPDFMLWLGDDVYLREADYYSRTGIMKRYTHDRAIKELQPLFGSVHHYAIWDDHDYGPNNSDKSYTMKDVTLEAFKLFWANPSYGVCSTPGITTYFQWSDVDFFLLDDRSYRTPEFRTKTNRKLLGDEQLEWLIDALTASHATFKVIAIGGQVLNPIKAFETYSTYPEEKEKLLNLIKDEGIKGVIFLSGDRHFSELSKLDREGTYPLYDFTISPFTAGPNNYPPEENYLRVENTFVQERNFALFEVTGKLKDRTLKCTVYDTYGKEKWSYKIHENELK